MINNWIKNYQNGNQYIKDKIILTLSKDINRNKWLVRIYNKQTKKDIYRYFRTRTLALTYYKSYMRKH